MYKKSIVLGKDLFQREVLWEQLESNTSVLISGLSGSGKSYLTNELIELFLKDQFDIVVISDKAKVDFKQANIKKINPLADKTQLEELIYDLENRISKLKLQIEQSEKSHAVQIDNPLKTIIIFDELWTINHLDKQLKEKVEFFAEILIRQSRYLGVFIIFVTQISSVSETNIPIRQCSIILTGKTDTKQLSESLFGSDIAYDNPALKTGSFVFWNRLKSPKIIKINKLRVLKKSIYKLWISKLLKLILTIFH